MSDFVTTHLAGGSVDKILHFPRFTIPYIKGKKLEAYGEGKFECSVELSEDAELIGIGFVGTEMNMDDYIEIELEGKKIVESVHNNQMHSSVVSVMNFKKAYFLKSKTPIRFRYISGNTNSDYKAVFANFHFLVEGSKAIKDDGDNGYDKYPDEDEFAKDSETFNLIGEDEDGGKSVEWNHKRYDKSDKFTVEEIEGVKRLISKTPMEDSNIPTIEGPVKVLEIIPYDYSTHPQNLSVLEYIDSKFGTIDGQKLFEIEKTDYENLKSKNLDDYEALFFSPSDCNSHKGIDDGTIISKIENFMDSGKAVVCCHDFFNYSEESKSLAKRFSITMDNNEPTYWSGFEVSVSITLRGQITDYPYKLPEKFKVMGYHRTSTTAKLGDNWIVDDVAFGDTDSYTKNYVWLTSNENCVFMEAGHSYYRCTGTFNNNPIDWECKAIINALFVGRKVSYKKAKATAEYTVNIPESNKFGGYIQLNMACYTKVVDNGKTILKPGACMVQIYNDNKLLEEIKFPQNDLDPEKYREPGWSTIEYNGKISIFPNTKKLKIKYIHTSSNKNACLELKKCDVTLYKK